MGPLANNGGPTLTHAPQPGSPALDKGSPAAVGSGGNACETTDQRGLGRPADGDGNGSQVCDIGAYEVGAFPVTFITYTYDPLYRLTAANYNNGTFFRYTYDGVGNRLTQATLTNTTVYTYDIANRLTNVGAQAYTWDNNGNLLSDGVFTYTYDSANRLSTLKQGTSLTYTYSYNGLGDRFKQVVNGVATTYTLDLNAGLTQVLADGTNTYLYGNGRIAQYAGTTPTYFLGDALGSVRQLTNSAGQVTLTKSYQPYGSVLSSAGTGATSYAFAGEWQDATNLIHLRARYYVPGQGRFLTADSWSGNYRRPLTLNRWNYSLSNPVNYADSSGHMVCFYGVDPRTGACKPNPLGSLLPPGIAGVLGNQQVLLPQETLVVLVILGLVCAVVASNLLTQARPVTWAEIYQLPEARGTVVPWWPQATPTSRPEHTFFFSDVGPYIPRGTDEIVADLEMYGLPGMAGSVSQLTSAQNSFDTGATWMIDILMGRKFEAERAIFFASRGALVQMNVSAPHYDLITRSFGPIQYVEVKWSRGPMPADTIRDVIESARTHPSGIYLVESNNIDEAARETLEEYGGTELPYPYP